MKLFPKNRFPNKRAPTLPSNITGQPSFHSLISRKSVLDVTFNEIPDFLSSFNI